MNIELIFGALVSLWLAAHFTNITLLRTKLQVEIVYRSGHVTTEWYKRFKVTYDTTREYGRITGLTWELLNGSGTSDTLFWGMEDIESVRVVKGRVSLWAVLTRAKD